jgi:hypothetical protein
VGGITLEGEADGVTNLYYLDYFPNCASWLCSLDSGSYSLCPGWSAASLGNDKVEIGLNSELEVEALVAMRWWKIHN